MVPILSLLQCLSFSGWIQGNKAVVGLPMEKENPDIVLALVAIGQRGDC